MLHADRLIDMDDDRFHLQLLGPADWLHLRSARLRALTESPTAFGTEYRHLACWSRREWLATFEAATWITAWYTGQIIGLAQSAHETHRSRNIESVWVEPSFRGRGICRRLFEAIIAHERHLGVDELRMWVFSTNDIARRAYARLGFVPTGEWHFLASVGQTEIRLHRPIGRAGAA
jgi:RimJ/RimL family protein N-acetyltransferase